MLKRYSTKEMEKNWSEAYKFHCWLAVEFAVLDARCFMKELRHDISCGSLIDKIKIDPEEINRIEREVTKHDVVAFLTYVSPQLPEALKPWFHNGMTSYDVVDTGLSLQLRKSVDILLSSLTLLMEAVKKRAQEYKYTPEIGRTHGIHAEPITFGVKLANWYDELKRHYARLKQVRKIVSVGKISGAVGMYTLDPRIEETVCEKYLQLESIVSTQIIPRDIVGDYVMNLGLIAASLSKFAIDLRLLAQTEIGEIMEPFSKDQKGSSAMPHKKNPISSENISGLSRPIRSNVQVAYDNLAGCFNERSLDNSAPERVIIPDSSIALDYLFNRLAGLIENMQVFPEKMLENLNLTKGLVYSQEVMMLVAEKSKLPREEAHTLVRDVALECHANKKDFLQELLKSEKIMQYVSAEELGECFDLDKKLKHVDYIFEKVFNKQEGGNNE